MLSQERRVSVTRRSSCEIPRLSHSPIAHPQRQAFACRWGCAKGLSLRSEKQWEFPLITWAHYAQWGTSNSNLYLHHPITKAWCQPIGGHVSYPTDDPIATRLELCSSLWDPQRDSLTVMLLCMAHLNIKTLTYHQIPLIHCDLMMPNGNIDLGQHCLR